MFDASVLVDALVVAGPPGDDAREVLRARSVLHVPSIFAAEATSAIRSMQARDNLTVYGGWYVALAESLDTSLVTADRRLAQASDPRCPVVEVAQFAAGSPGPPTQRSRPE